MIREITQGDGSSSCEDLQDTNRDQEKNNEHPSREQNKQIERLKDVVKNAEKLSLGPEKVTEEKNKYCGTVSFSPKKVKEDGQTKKFFPKFNIYKKLKKKPNKVLCSISN